MMQFWERVEQTGGASVFVFCDPILTDPVLALTGQGFNLPVPKTVRMPLSRGLQPFTLPIPSDLAGEKLLQATFEIALGEVEFASANLPAPRSVCAWLMVDAVAVAALHANLSQAARPPKGLAGSSLFRYWDPRVFAHLIRILGSTALSAWLGSKMRWCWLDWAGQLQCFDASPSEAMPQYLEAPQLAALERIAEVNQCLVHSGQALALDQSRALLHFDSLVEYASQSGCRSATDRVLFALLSSQFGRGFERAEALQPYFNDFLQRKSDFSTCAASVPETVWEVLAHSATEARK